MAQVIVVTKDSANGLEFSNSTTSVVTTYQINRITSFELVEDTAAALNIVEMQYDEGTLRFTFTGSSSKDPDEKFYDDVNGVYDFQLAPIVTSVEGVATTTAVQMRDLLVTALQEGYLGGQTAVPASERGTLILGTDGTDYQPLATDTSGNLQVDIVSGGATATEYTEDTVKGATDIDGPSILAVQRNAESSFVGGDDRFAPLQTNADGALRVTLGQEVGKTRDVAAGANDVGVQTLAVRNDTESVLAGTDGDYTPLQTNDLGALRVTLSGGEVVHLEDTAHTSGDAGTMPLAVRNDVGNAVLAGTTSDYIPLSTDQHGNLRMGVYSTYDLAVRRNLMTGHSIVRVQGVIPDMDTTTGPAQPTRVTPISVWPGVNLTPTSTPVYDGFQTGGAEVLDIVSNNVTDVSPAVGAHSVTLTGLDASGDVITFGPVNLNGTTSVNTGAQTFTRLLSAQVSATGTDGNNVGTIEITGATSSGIYGIIEPRTNKTSQANYTVASGSTLYITHLTATVGGIGRQQNGTRYITFALKGGPTGVLREEYVFTVTNTHGPVEINTTGISFAADEDVVIDIVDSNNTGNDNLYVAAGFVGYLIENSITDV